LSTKNRSNTRIAGALLGAAVIAGAGYYYYRAQHPNEDLTQADPWTVLQAVEAAHRADQDSRTPVFLEHAEGTKYSILGLPTQDVQFPLAWVIVNEATADGSFKMIPKAKKVYVPCAYVQDLTAKTEVDPQVAKYLRSACTG
jgi:hypothetical protein